MHVHQEFVAHEAEVDQNMIYDNHIEYSIAISSLRGVATRLSQPLQHYGDENKIVRVEDIAGMEELRKLGPKRNLAEELY